MVQVMRIGKHYYLQAVMQGMSCYLIDMRILAFKAFDFSALCLKCETLSHRNDRRRVFLSYP